MVRAYQRGIFPSLAFPICSQVNPLVTMSMQRRLWPTAKDIAHISVLLPREDIVVFPDVAFEELYITRSQVKGRSKEKQILVATRSALADILTKSEVDTNSRRERPGKKKSLTRVGFEPTPEEWCLKPPP